jgi:O-antigen ligase
MSLGILYWLLMVLFLVLGMWSSWPNLRAGSPNILLFLILVVVGWKVFGPPINS